MMHLGNNGHIQDCPNGHLIWPQTKWFILFLSYNPITVLTIVWHHSLLIMSNQMNQGEIHHKAISLHDY